MKTEKQVIRGEVMKACEVDKNVVRNREGNIEGVDSIGACQRKIRVLLSML